MNASLISTTPFAHRLHYRWKILESERNHIRTLIPTVTNWDVFYEEEKIEHLSSDVENYIQGLRKVREITFNHLLKKYNYPSCITRVYYKSFISHRDFIANTQSAYHTHVNEDFTCNYDGLSLTDLLTSQEISILEAFQPFWSYTGISHPATKHDVLKTLSAINNYSKHEGFLSAAPVSYLQKNWSDKKIHPRVRRGYILGLRYGQDDTDVIALETVCGILHWKYKMTLSFVIPLLSEEQDEISSNWEHMYDFYRSLHIRA